MEGIDLTAAFSMMPLLSGLYRVRATAFPATYGPTNGMSLIQTIASDAEPVASGGFYQQIRCSFKLSLLDLSAAGITPVMGDQVTDPDGNAWIVVKSHKGSASWSVGAVRFIIGPDRVDWKKLNQTTNAFGDRITDPNTFTIGGVFSCRVQPADNTILDMFGKRGALQHYVVYLLSDQQFTFGDLLIQTNAANRKFIIRDWRSREDIQNAMVILCEVLP